MWQLTMKSRIILLAILTCMADILLPASQVIVKNVQEETLFGYAHKHPYRFEVSETSMNGIVTWKYLGGWQKLSRKDEIHELKQKLADAEKRTQTVEEKLKHVSWKLGIFERDLLDVGGVVSGPKWEGGRKSFVCPEVFSGFTNVAVRFDKNGFVDGIRLVRRLTPDGSEVTSERFPSEEEQKVIHQMENNFHVRFAIDTYPGTYKWKNPFERVRIRIDFRDKQENIIRRTI